MDFFFIIIRRNYKNLIDAILIIRFESLCYWKNKVKRIFILKCSQKISINNFNIYISQYICH